MLNIKEERDSSEIVNFIKRWWSDLDKTIFIIAISLIIFGFIMTISSSPAIAKRIGVDKLFFIKKQAVFIVFAIFIMMAISMSQEIKLKNIAFAGLVASILLLILAYFIGSEAKGSKRWINLFGITVQPSEIAKSFFIIVNAYFLNKYINLRAVMLKNATSISLLLIIIILIVGQPDVGMTITFIAIWSAQIFVAGISIFGIGIIIAAGLCLIAITFITMPHVQERITTFLKGMNGETAKNYQVEKALDAFANGSLFGVGPANGVVKNFIPDAHTDFIFAVIGEEFGFFCCIMLIATFLIMIRSIFRHIIKERDLFSYIALTGLVSQLTIQIIVNIAVSINLAPTKGMTLPFISYGGSSMISTAICLGFILALTKKKYHQELDYGNIKWL